MGSHSIVGGQLPIISRAAVRCNIGDSTPADTQNSLLLHIQAAPVAGSSGRERADFAVTPRAPFLFGRLEVRLCISRGKLRLLWARLPPSRRFSRDFPVCRLVVRQLPGVIPAMSVHPCPRFGGCQRLSAQASRIGKHAGALRRLFRKASLKGLSGCSYLFTGQRGHVAPRETTSAFSSTAATSGR